MATSLSDQQQTYIEEDPAAEVVRSFAWLQELIARMPVLAATQPKVVERFGQICVEVTGQHYEARAWRAATAGRIRPSWIDLRGVRHQLVIGANFLVEVVDRRPD